MFTCSACGHTEMVHHMFVGCCHVADCPCLGMDGTRESCEPAVHAAEHNVFVPLPEPKDDIERLERRTGRTVTLKERRKIVKLKRAGHGSRDIARTVGVNRTLVIAIIHAALGKGPATQPRTRPRADDRQRALDAGITREEFAAERGEGGRAQTVDALNAWIVERSAPARG